MVHRKRGSGRDEGVLTSVRRLELLQRVDAVCDVLEFPERAQSFETEKARAWVKAHRVDLERLGRTHYSGAAAARAALRLWNEQRQEE